MPHCTMQQFLLPPHTIAAHVTAEVYAAYVAAVTTGTEAAVIAALDTDFQARLQALSSELIAAHAGRNDDEAARIAELHVLDNILQLKCPRCSAAIHDFEGSMGFQCYRCRGHFCGWCLTSHGGLETLVSHVRSCPLNAANGDVWTTQEQFNSAHSARRQHSIQQYMTTLEADVQAALKVRLNRRLSDFGMQLL